MYVCAGTVLGQVTSVKKKVSRHSASRNSAHLTGSSLQEDLMKLISPEYAAPPPATPPATPTPLSRLILLSLLWCLFSLSILTAIAL